MNTYNHFTFKVLLHEIINNSKENINNNRTKTRYEIVGFITYPSSISQNENNLGCNKYNKNITNNNTYDIIIPNYESLNNPEIINIITKLIK